MKCLDKYIFHPSNWIVFLIVPFCFLEHSTFSQSVYIVNSLNDFEDVNLADQNCADKFGDCTLRAAIQNANKSYLRDQIYFELPGKGPFEIILQELLPIIIYPVEIDGRLRVVDHKKKVVVFINGINLLKISSENLNGLHLAVNSDESIIKNLGFHSFYGNAIRLESDKNIIQFNLFGGFSSDCKPGNHTAISIRGSNNLIGGTHPYEQNTFINNIYGTSVYGPNNKIVGNFFGVEEDGHTESGNLYGISLGYGASNCLIFKNLISGNFYGINSSASGTVFQKNLIGTDLSGTKKIGNSIGINLYSVVKNVKIGLENSGNIISGNEIGIFVSNESEFFLRNDYNSFVSIEGNKIGTDIYGKFPLGNERGIVIKGTGDIIIGGNSDQKSNLISGNLESGIELLNAFEVIVQGNKLGTDQSGKYAIPNFYGIFLEDKKSQFHSNNIIRGNLISGNQLGGIYIGREISNIKVVSNKIGLKESFASSLPNQSFAIFMESHIQKNCIGSLVEDEKNLIFGEFYFSDKHSQTQSLMINNHLISTNSNTFLNEIIFLKISPILNYRKLLLIKLVNNSYFKANSNNLDFIYNSINTMDDFY